MEKKKKNSIKKRSVKRSFLWKFFVGKLLQNIDALVVVSDAKRGVVFANGKCLDFLGCSRRALAGRDWVGAMIPASRHGAIREVFGRIKKKKMFALFGTPVKGKGEDENYVCWAAVPLKARG